MAENKLDEEKLEKVTGADGISGEYKPYTVKCPYCLSSDVSLEPVTPENLVPGYVCNNCGVKFTRPSITRPGPSPNK
ncbi:MAG: hypothetical protein IJH53_06010 [Oscillospiraceae bacterium]|nr:hypothetical protein [Oscillospiraceae bacterium]